MNAFTSFGNSITSNISNNISNINNNPVSRASRLTWLAWLGANKTAFNLAQTGAEKLNASRAQLVTDLVEKGQGVEDQAQNGVELAKQYIKPRFDNARSSVTAVSNKLFAANTTDAADDSAVDQIEVLTAAIADLTKTVGDLTEKVNAPRTRAAKKPAAQEVETEAKA